MQKLEMRNTYKPTNSSHVRSNFDLQLNREETLSVASLKTVSNNLEGNLAQRTGRSLKANVFVLNNEGQPLMPCSYAKSKRMVKSGKAKVVRRAPFTIRINFECENVVQEIVLGIDTGFGNMGFSAVTEKKELVCGTLKLDGRTSKRLAERRMYRRGRRNKLWYRQPRFLNRNMPIGWLPPSTQRRYDTHISLIVRLKRLLPISKVILEVAKFDIQKIENPSIEGKDYQQGNMYEYQNTRSYLMVREKGLCQLCGKDFKKQPSHIHHCRQKNESGSSRAKNLAILHKKCHKKLHKKGLKLKAPKEYKASIFMSIVNKKFWNDIPNMQMTYGNITFVNRNKLGLEKTHFNDAFVVAEGTEQSRTKPYEIIQRHRNNRVLQLNRKGFKPSIKKNKSKISPLDLFWVKGIKYICKGMFSYGKYVLYGDAKKKEYFKTTYIEKYFNQGSFAWTWQRTTIHPLPKGRGFFVEGR